MTKRGTSHGAPAGVVIATEFEGWSVALRAEFARNEFNGRVGTTLVSQSDRVRIWLITVGPGERLPAHRHVLDYFWVALAPGTSIQHTSDGSTRQVRYERGTTRHFSFGPGEHLLHDLENDGESELTFATVEFLDSANPPLSLDATDIEITEEHA